jgi:hypothetical protein
MLSLTVRPDRVLRPNKAGRRISAALLGFLLVASTAWITASSSSPAGSSVGVPAGRSSSPAASHGGRTVPAVGQVSIGLRTSFALFRTPSEGLPRELERTLPHPARHGINWNLAQRMPTGTPSPMWAVPGRGVICLLERQMRLSAGISCTTTDYALRHGLETILLSPSGSVRSSRLIVGLAPDGTRAVVAKTTKSKIRIPVGKNGVFVRRDSRSNPPDSFALISRERPRSRSSTPFP